ncbi:MAG: amidohydrolase family protein [Methanomassiliicoccus sp.]|nr:amidohydrolase family protein [Methanomassiliicoccus sp.]
MLTIVRNARIVTQNAERQVVSGDILIRDGTIEQVGGEVRGSADREIDAAGGIVLPGLINTHTHVSMAILKGIADDLPFTGFLDRVFAVDARRTERDIRAGAAQGCLEMIRSGTTTFMDLYYSADVIAGAVESSGIRGILGWAVLDQEFTTQSGVPLDNCKRFHREFRDRPRIYPAVGLQGVYVCSTETFLGAGEFALENDLLINLHLSETRKEVSDCKRKEGKRPGDYLASIGFLNDHCIAAHSAWLTINEVRALAAAGTRVSTCPVSNMKLATGGVAPVPEMLQNGVIVSIGTDGSTTNNSLDLFGEMKFLSLLQKSSRWDPTVLPAQQVLDMVTIDAARAVRMDHLIGSVEVGKRADLIVLDGKAANLRPARPETIVSNLVYSSFGTNVRTVLCDGNVLMEDGKVTSMDEERVLAEAEDAARVLLG